MARNYAALPHEYLEEMEALNDAEFGRLTRALLTYSMTGEPIALCGNERFYAKRVMTQEDRFKASYDEQSARKREAGKAGAASRWNGKNGSAISANGKNGNTETETETETKTISKETAATAASKKAAAAPTVAEVKALCDKFGYAVDAEEFVAVYSENGWTVKGEPVQDWRALVRGWARTKAKDAEEGDIFD